MHTAMMAAINPYDTELFYQCWWEHLAPRFNITNRYGDWLVHRKPLFKNWVSLKELRLAGWNQAWFQTITLERANALRELPVDMVWDYGRVTCHAHQPENQVQDVLRQAGLCPVQIALPPYPVVDLSDGYDAYMKAKSGKNRYEVTRKHKRVNHMNPQLVMMPTDVQSIDAFFDRLFPAHFAYWDAKVGESYFHHPCEQAFIRAFAKALAQQGQLRLDGLTLQGEIAYLNLSIICGDELYWPLCVGTGLHADLTPGFVSLYMRLEEAAHTGIRVFHMGPGDYEYKVKAANRMDPPIELLFANPKSLAGKAYVAWLKRRLRPPVPC
jgi:hypothetical protein